MREKRHPYVAYALLVIILGLTFLLSSQQGMNSHNLSINICKKIVTFLNHNAKLSLDEKQYLNFIRFLDVPIRKAAHITEYAVLGIVLYVIVSAYIRSIWERIVYVIVVIMLVGSLDEAHQLYVLAREGKWQDVVIDVIGGCFGMAATIGLYRRNEL